MRPWTLPALVYIGGVEVGAGVVTGVTGTAPGTHGWAMVILPVAAAGLVILVLPTVVALPAVAPTCGMPVVGTPVVAVPGTAPALHGPAMVLTGAPRPVTLVEPGVTPLGFMVTEGTPPVLPGAPGVWLGRVTVLWLGVVV